MSESYLKDCIIITRKETAIYGSEGTDALFGENDDGSVFVRLDRYLIVPKEMFTDRQINYAMQKWRKRQLS